MAEHAVRHLPPGSSLRGLLEAQRPSLLSGAAYPDSGYAASSFPGGDFGEVSHWERFINAYVDHIRSLPSCRRTLHNPVGPCASLVAHLMGAAAHGMGDEMWDWLFEPLMADHGENPSTRTRVDDTPGWAELSLLPAGQVLQDSAVRAEHLALSPFSGLIYSSEYTMDVIAIADHGRLVYSPAPPPTEDLLAVYGSLGRPDITREGIVAGHALVTAALAAERLSVAEAHSVRADMPYSSAHLDDESGGVRDTARAITGYYQALWRNLLAPRSGPKLKPRVAAVHPERGERGVPVEWHPPKTSPGPSGGGARLRIIAVLSKSLDPASVDWASFRLLDPNGDPVPALAGFPRPGPYGAGDGTHSMMFYPAGDLDPCAAYTAEVTTALRDHDGEALKAPFSWSFRTGGAGGARCP